jgi:ABC-type transport system substrate-binding protein
MYQAAKTTFDRTKRQQLYFEAGKYFHEQAPSLFLWTAGSNAVGNPKLTWKSYHSFDFYTTVDRAA